MKVIYFGLLVALILTGCGGSSPNTSQSTSEAKVEEELTSGVVYKAANVAVAVAAQVTPPIVTAIALKNQRRIARTVFEYEFTVQISTGSAPLNSITFSLQGVGQGSQIIDGSVVTGAVVANSNITATDTIIVNHDRTQAFDPNALIWSVSSVPASIPQPALGGVDANGDGVRDDVEAFIKTSPLVPQPARAALAQLALGMQDSLLAKTKSEALTATKKRMDSAVCLAGIVSPENASKLMGQVFQRQFDTPDRIAAEINYRALIGGEAFWPDFSKPSQAFCK